ncbi:MAG: DUF342 domain-containing protein [Lachnospiraceae bacterium]
MNAYFQLIMNQSGTAIRLVPPSDGGEKINVAELTEYLQLKNVEVSDMKVLYQAIAALDKEVVVPLTPKCGFPEQEMFSLRVSEDRMEAIVRFYPPSNNGSPISGKDEILYDLKCRNVVFGYDEAAIETYLANRNYCEDIVVARGQEPVQGQDARIEYFFNTDLSTRPTRNEDGSVDFFHLNTINHCKTGDVLAKLYKEVHGQPGYTVYGEKISPRDIKHLTLKYGRNISLSEDGCTITSDLNGHVCLTGDKVFVSDVYEVENVGPATGNIESEGSVLVTGNVQAGFSIKAKGNVEVRGVVEGATIETDGDIIIARGMNGMGKGVLNAGGRIILKFAENATINAGAYVESESILHSNVSANTEVIVDGKKGFIAGGVVRATEKISCKTLGSSMGADTVVEVGVNPEQKKRYQDLQKEVMDITKNLKNIQPILVNATQKLKKGEKFPPEQMKYIQTLAVANKQQTERLEADQAELKQLDEMMQSQKQACVCVSDDVYAGTKIAIGDVSMVLKSTMRYCRFIRERGDIKATSY